MNGRLDPGLADSWGLPAVELWDSIGSTNDRARALASEGAAPGTVVLAREQTAGRGRRGRAWLSPAGDGVWMSLVLAPGDARPLLPLAVATAAAAALESETGVEVGLKWPNDLIAQGGKLGGILVERGPDWVVAGIGVNVAGAPPASEVPDGLRPTSLRASGAGVVLPFDLAGAIARSIVRSAAVGDGDVIREIRRRDVLEGRAVRTEEHGAGIARGITDGGMLLLERADGSLARVASGWVRMASNA